ncbi:hypothetical protein [Neisseria elongata]|uniref:Uncharacterized protein n=1 Tax=Neisseria elongata subsp. nitroreducens TaxID=90367 RepID=A0A9X1CZF5_NEIEL|nr:hypothetical protein [Neisseria elongata]MBS9340428.1 hypothetical protein [Neisseria elongata subsp. nitroreducens]
MDDSYKQKTDESYCFLSVSGGLKTYRTVKYPFLPNTLKTGLDGYQKLSEKARPADGANQTASNGVERCLRLFLQSRRCAHDLSFLPFFI